MSSCVPTGRVPLFGSCSLIWWNHGWKMTVEQHWRKTDTDTDSRNNLDCTGTNFTEMKIIGSELWFTYVENINVDKSSWAIAQFIRAGTKKNTRAQKRRTRQWTKKKRGWNHENTLWAMGTRTNVIAVAGNSTVRGWWGGSCKSESVNRFKGFRKTRLG